MINEIVENNKGIIGSYEVVDKYIYVRYLDKYVERYEYNESVINEIKDKMISQAIEIIKYNKNNEAKTEKMYNAISLGLLGVLACVSAAYNHSAGIDLRLSDVIVECIGMGIVPLVSRSAFGYMHLDDKAAVDKYHIFLTNYKGFCDYINDEHLYLGVENKGEININTIDNYSLAEVRIMSNNIMRLRKREEK